MMVIFRIIENRPVFYPGKYPKTTIFDDFQYRTIQRFSSFVFIFFLEATGACLSIIIDMGVSISPRLPGGCVVV
jgi:hypothetical protein